MFSTGDAPRLQQILWNLLSNALKFTPHGGRVRCSFERRPEERVLISIQDSGPGVPDSLKVSVFDRYAQGADEHSAKGSGLSGPTPAG